MALISRSRDGRSVEIGLAIHQAVVDEGRREGVFAYLTRDENGRAFFQKYDPKANGGNGEFHSRFSKSLADRIICHREDLRAYVRWLDHPPAPLW